MNQTIIALHSPTAVKEVFDKHAASNTNRPASAIVDIITPTMTSILALHIMVRSPIRFRSGKVADQLILANDTWKQMRKLSSSVLTTKAVQQYTKVQQAEATQTIVGLIHEPDVSIHIHMDSTSRVLR